MSETHRQHAIGLVQAYYAAFNRGDWDGMLAFLAEDVAHDLNQGPREIGRNEFAAFLQRMNDSYREQLRDVVVIANDDGTRVGAEYVVHGVYHTTDEGLPEYRANLCAGGRCVLRRARRQDHPRDQLLQPAGMDCAGIALSTSTASASAA